MLTFRGLFRFECGDFYTKWEHPNPAVYPRQNQTFNNNTTKTNVTWVLLLMFNFEFGSWILHDFIDGRQDKLSVAQRKENVRTWLCVTNSLQ